VCGKKTTKYFFLSCVGLAFKVDNGQSALEHRIPACHFPLHYTWKNREALKQEKLACVLSHMAHKKTKN